jgi:hypothetical protein
VRWPISTSAFGSLREQTQALEGYRSRNLSEEQVRRLLGFDSRFQVQAFLKQHNTYLNYTETDLDNDLAVARNLGQG